ncbi:DUF4062 domain-containing protein [Arthrobacter sp. UNCCL28]|uniref:DUF4062 domain-containing protein n=1 Tax=Micrococcaceae TaxID=1268 RepID=UPI0034A0FE85
MRTGPSSIILRRRPAESCLREVSHADIFVLLIGGRYGSKLPSSDLSVTNGEFQAAVEKKIPVFALVEQGTYNDYALYRANAAKPDLIDQVSFPHADTPKIFEFIESVQGRTTNNALVPFASTASIESYLRSQWASMMHSFLTNGSKEAQVVDTLAVLTNVNERVEVIAEQILRSVGTSEDRLYVRLLQEMIQSSVVSDLRFMDGKPTPGVMLSSRTVQECALSLGIDLRELPDLEGHEDTIGASGQVSPIRLARMERQFIELQARLIAITEEYGLAPESVVAYEITTKTKLD